ncbi:unnamed protein product, partial [Laminaria digitata]
EAAGEEKTLSQGTFDPEMPYKPEWSCSPRSLAVHPEGLQVACGDKRGNIRVYDMVEMELAHSQEAHDAEVLCLSYSPIMLPTLVAASATATATAAATAAAAAAAAASETKSRSPKSRVGSEYGGGIGGGGGLKGVHGEAAGAGTGEAVLRWEAIDPLDPLAAEKLLLRRAGAAGNRGSSSGSGGGGGRGGGGGQGDGGAKGNPDDDRQPLVLLASASRDRLVRVFDASSTLSKCDGCKQVDGRRGDILGDTEAGPRAGIKVAGGGVGGDVEGGGGGGGSGVWDGDGAAGAVAAGCFPLVKTLDYHTGSVTAVKFSKDGKRLISAGGDKTLVLNSVRGPEVNRYKSVSVSQGTIYGLDVDPTNKYMVTVGQDKRLNIWSIASGKPARSYKVEATVSKDHAVGSAAGGGGGGGGGVHVGRGGGRGGGRGDAGGELFKVDLDPTGMYAAACSFDKWIRLFDFYSGKCLAKVAGHSELATGVRFTPDGRRLVSTGGDGVMFVWRLSSELQQSMRERMCELRPGAGSGGRVGVSDSVGASVGASVSASDS